MTKHLVASGLLAGFVVALLATLLQFAFVERGILLAERYESDALQHFGGVGGHDHAAAAPAAHDHAEQGTADLGGTAVTGDKQRLPRRDPAMSFERTAH